MKLKQLIETDTHFLTVEAEIKEWLDEMRVENYTIKNGIVDVNDDVCMSSRNLKTIPVSFGKVTGGFYCVSNQLTSLAGSPSSVGDSFYCNGNQLTSLAGSPSSVGDSFYCNHNRLTHLEGAPSYVTGEFACDNNQITSLVGVSKIFKHVGNFWYNFDKIEQGGLGLILVAKKISDPNKLKLSPPFQIIEKYLGKGNSGVVKCQQELIENDFDEYAKL